MNHFSYKDGVVFICLDYTYLFMIPRIYHCLQKYPHSNIDNLAHYSEDASK